MAQVESTVPVDYVNHFWGEKHSGFHVLYENMKRGEETVNEIAQFLKERLSIEEEYGKLLGKSVNRMSSFINAGSSLEGGWCLTKGTFDILVDVQTMMVKNLQDLSREVAKYKEEVVKSRKETKQQDVIDAVNLMQTTTTCLQKAKETYHSRTTELDKLRKESNPNPKELAKVESKLVKARDEYRAYVEKYDVVRINFEEKMTKACKLFQSHDRSHYAVLQQFLMLYASHHQEAAFSTQQLCGQLRESLQLFRVDDILAKFVKDKGTGTEKPAPLSLEEFDVPPPVPSSSPPPDEHLAPPTFVGTTNSQAIPTESPAILKTSVSHPPNSAANDLLSLEVLDAWTDKKHVEPSPTASQSSDSLAATPTAAQPTQTGASLFSSSSMGIGLSMLLPKRKKTISQGSLGEVEGTTVGAEGGGLFKFRQNRRSKKSNNDLSTTTENKDPFGMEDAQSTASSSRSEDKPHFGGSAGHILDAPLTTAPRLVDEEGFTIPSVVDDEKEDTNWSSCSSDDEEDENVLQQSKIRSISIKPADSVRTMNASVDELRDAIGHISIGRSSTFDKDPWSVGGRAPVFSQSLTGGSLKPLRPAHTADGRFRTNFSESEFARSNVPLNFSASCGPAAGMARARPRSNTPTHNSSFALNTNTANKDINGSQDWGFAMNGSDSQQSLGESSFNLSQSTANLMQATINEQRIPVAMAVNEYSHVWFKGADVTSRTVRVFGTVMISFSASSLSLLTDVHSDIEQLQFTLNNAKLIKAVLPNKQLLLPPSVAKSQSDSYQYTFDRLGLANWLLAQQKEKPTAAFYNAEVVRYELCEDAGNGEPPLLFTSYWKCEHDHTDIRIDYRLNSVGPVTNPLLNLVFSTKIDSQVASVTSDPQADWCPSSSSLSWSVTELSRHGDCGGSLKARLHLKEDSDVTKPAHSHAQFQCSDSTISGVSVELSSSDTYHLSMVRRKVLAGKYFCEPELRR